MKKIYFVLLIALLLMVGCNTTDNDEVATTTEQVAQTTTEPVEEESVEKVVTKAFGEELRLAIRNPETLNPLVNEEDTVDKVLGLCFESLFVIDESGVPQPKLVETYVLADDNSSITLTLKNDILFHNEELLTSEDVDYSIDVLKSENGSAIYKGLVSNIQRVSIVDKNNIKIYFHQSYAFSLYDLVFPILDKSYYTENENADLNPVGTGPYKYESFVSMKALTFTYFDGYREDFWIENVLCTITRDEEVEVTAFKQNLVDMVTPMKINWQTYYEDDTNRLYEYTSNYYEMIGFNFDNELLIENKMRYAFAYGINRDEILDDIYLSHGTITDSIIKPDSWLSSGKSIKYNYNVSKATEMLEELGYSDQDTDGLYDYQINGITNNVSFTLLVNEDNSLRVKIADMIREDMLEVGLNINVEAVNSEVFVERLVNGDYDIVLTAIKLSDKPDYTDLFHSESVVQGNNFINYKSEFMNAVLEAIYKSGDNEALLDNMNQFENLFIEELPYFSLVFMNSAIITNDDIYSDTSEEINDIQQGLNQWYISR